MRGYEADAENDTEDEGGRTGWGEVRRTVMNTTTARTGLAGRGGLGDEGGRTSSDEEEEDAGG